MLLLLGRTQLVATVVALLLELLWMKTENETERRSAQLRLSLSVCVRVCVCMCMFVLRCCQPLLIAAEKGQVDRKNETENG